MEALELEETVKNHERSSSNGWFVLIMFYYHFPVSFYLCSKLDSLDLKYLYAAMLGHIFQASGLLAMGSWVLPLTEWVIARYINPFLSFEFEF